MSMTTGPGVARRRGSVRLKLFALAGVGMLSALVASAVGLSGLAAVNADVEILDVQVARPFAAFANLRDAEGDSRVNVWTYLAARSDEERAAIADEIAISDAAVHESVASFLANDGEADGEHVQAMKKFESDFEAWKALRDTVVLPAADGGDTVAAYAAMKGPLEAANEAMGAPLDDLFIDEQKEGMAVAAEAHATYAQVRSRLALAVGAGLLLGLAAAWFLTRVLLRPIAVVRESLARLAVRDLTWEPPTMSGNDELTQMVVASGEATRGMRDVVAQVAQSLETLNGSVARLQGSSAEMNSAAGHAASQVEGATLEVQVVNGNMQTVASGTEQMSISIREIAAHAHEAAQVAKQAVDAAQATDGRVRRLNDSSAEIMSIVNAITSIAGQTNLLALNATIEAARAGEAGKGFAVVAGEVKELANETTRATDDIIKRVKAIQEDTGDVVNSIDQIRSVIERINELQTTVAVALEEQTATTGEINRSVSQAASASDRIAERMHAVGSATTETSAGVRTTRASADELHAMSDKIALAIGSFTV